MTTLHGTVAFEGSAPDRVPLDRARVLLRGGGVDCDATGRFTATLLASGAKTSIVVRHPDAVKLTAGLLLQAGELRRRFRLAPCMDVEMRVVDAAGRAVAAPIRVEAPEGNRDLGEGRRVGSGRYRFEGLPRRPTTFVVSIAGRRFTERVDPAARPPAGGRGRKPVTGTIEVPNQVRVRPEFPATVPATVAATAVHLEFQDVAHPRRTFRVSFERLDT